MATGWVQGKIPNEEGRHLAQGEFDELTTFSRVLGQSELAANYGQYAGRTLLGPIWPGENSLASVPFPGESTNSFTGSTTSVMRAVSYGCGLWVELGRTNSATNVVLTLHNTIPGTNYQVWSKTSLGETSWTLETNMVGASGQDWTAKTLPMRGRSNLFVIASEIRTDAVQSAFRGLGESNTLLSVADTMGAVGVNQFVELLNGFIAVYSKGTGDLLSHTNAEIFFRLTNNGTIYPTGGGMIDPRVLYDHQAGHWIACAIDGVDAGMQVASKHVILAVSTNESPTNLMHWKKYLVPVAVSGADSDYATLGTDTNGIYISVVHRKPEGGRTVNAGHTVVAIKRPEIYFDENLQTRFELDTNASDLKVWTIQPAVRFDSSSTNDYAWLLAKGPPQLGSDYLGGAILYRRLRWVNSTNPTAELVDANWLAVTHSPEVNYRDYFDVDGTNTVKTPIAPTTEAPQKDSALKISLVGTGSRLMNAVIRDGFVYTCQHIGLNRTDGSYSGNETGSNVDRSGVQWLKLRIEADGTLSYYRHGRIYDTTSTNAMYYYFPSIAVNCASDMLLGFSGSSTSNYISAYYTWQPGVAPIENYPVVLLQAGLRDYNGSRWGDYSFTTLDPTDNLTFWTVQEYATENRDWGTYVAEITVSK